MLLAADNQTLNNDRVDEVHRIGLAVVASILGFLPAQTGQSPLAPEKR